jgi:hypothetical protein
MYPGGARRGEEEMGGLGGLMIDDLGLLILKKSPAVAGPSDNREVRGGVSKAPPKSRSDRASSIINPRSAIVNFLTPLFAEQKGRAIIASA